MCSISVKKSERMILETDRLKIIPLSVEQSKILLTGMNKLERELNLTPSNYVLNTETLEAVQYLYNKAIAQPGEPFFNTFWQIMLKLENKIVASACFKNEPDEDGILEIGYGTNPGYRNRGIMTEAVKIMIEWAFEHPSVNCIIAETYKENPASHRVLEKNEMIIYKETEEAFWWKLEKQTKKL